MPRQIQLVILCEDQQQAFFARHYFIQRGIHPRKIRVNINPGGQGSAEQYVREQYLREVIAYRSRSSHLAIALAVLIDADNYSVEQRMKQLTKVLEDNSQRPRQNNERIALFVPKRNIETWIHYLRDTAVDEESDYPKLVRTGDCKPDVIRLVTEICPVGLPEDAPPSLQVACDELSRIMP
jgi:hypothetical protein